MCIFSFGFWGYMLIEILWRGYTHITMGITGGICLVGLFTVERVCCKLSIVLKSITGALLITAFEFVAGYIVNIKLGYGVWDYSGMKFNFMGQICALYTFFWFLLCLVFFYFFRILVSKGVLSSKKALINKK